MGKKDRHGTPPPPGGCRRWRLKSSPKKWEDSYYVRGLYTYYIYYLFQCRPACGNFSSYYQCRKCSAGSFFKW